MSKDGSIRAAMSGELGNSSPQWRKSSKMISVAVKLLDFDGNSGGGSDGDIE
jgi:hypothetical protein